MANGVKGRLVGFLVGIDEAFNALGGGKPVQTISGTIGRGVIAGRWWAGPARYLVDGIFGRGHCVTQAQREAPPAA